MFLSDFHLGTKNAKAELLLEFLDSHDAETIFLVGDIVDIWRLQKHPHWPGPHNEVLQALLRKARRGARLILIPGNHDEALREYCGQTFGPVSLELNAIHVTADGQRFVVMHGDEFDIVVCHAPWLAHFGDSAYNFALWLNSRFNSVRRTAGLGYWSLSAFLKRKVKQAVNFIGRYETTLAREAQRRDADGIICGHIHHAAMRRINGITYINTGDWVESCTAVVEHSSGVLELVYWGQRKPVSRWRRRRTSTAELVPAE
ncbi:MAG: UDP-2,3-diacylglucosamine diphosphatase [Pseudomonadota bacterium]